MDNYGTRVNKTKNIIVGLIAIVLIAMFFAHRKLSLHAAEIVGISGIDFIDKVRVESSGSPKVIVTFASWCGHCRSLIADVFSYVESENRKAAPGKIPVKFYLLSLDEDVESLKNFVKLLPGDTLPVYNISSNAQLSRVFYSLSIEYQNAVPHITVLDSKNKAVFNDNGELRHIKRILQDLS